MDPNNLVDASDSLVYTDLGLTRPQGLRALLVFGISMAVVFGFVMFAPRRAAAPQVVAAPPASLPAAPSPASQVASAADGRGLAETRTELPSR